MHFRYEGNDRNFPLLLHFLEREISQLPRDVKSALKKSLIIDEIFAEFLSSFDQKFLFELIFPLKL